MSRAGPCAGFWATMAMARISAGRPTRSPKAATRNSRFVSARHQSLTAKVCGVVPDGAGPAARGERLLSNPSADLTQMRRMRLPAEAAGLRPGLPGRGVDGSMTVLLNHLVAA